MSTPTQRLPDLIKELDEVPTYALELACDQELSSMAIVCRYTLKRIDRIEKERERRT